MREITIRCEICHEQIAKADPDLLRRPMMGSMFKSVDAWHGVPDPFPPTAEWADMLCPHGLQHRPFTTENHVMLDSGDLLEVEYPDPPKPMEELLICEICGREIKGAGPMASHMRVHNG